MVTDSRGAVVNGRITIDAGPVLTTVALITTSSTDAVSVSTRVGLAGIDLCLAILARVPLRAFAAVTADLGDTSSSIQARPLQTFVEMSTRCRDVNDGIYDVISLDVAVDQRLVAGTGRRSDIQSAGLVGAQNDDLLVVERAARERRLRHVERRLSTSRTYGDRSALCRDLDLAVDVTSGR